MFRPEAGKQCLILFVVIENTSYKEIKESDGEKKKNNSNLEKLNEKIGK